MSGKRFTKQKKCLEFNVFLKKNSSMPVKVRKIYCNLYMYGSEKKKRFLHFWSLGCSFQFEE